MWPPCECLPNAGPSVDAVLPDVIKLLQDEQVIVRIEAARPEQDRAIPVEAVTYSGPRPDPALSHLPGRSHGIPNEAIPALIQLLRDKDPTARRVAAEAMGQTGPEAEEAVRLLLQDGDPQVRDAGSAALERIALMRAYRAAEVRERRGFYVELDQYKQAVRSGFAKIPQANQIERLLGEAGHFISYDGNPRLIATWNTHACFADRYVMFMRVDLQMDQRFSTIVKVIGSPRFQMYEIEHAYSGGHGARYLSVGRGSFGLDTWEKIVQAEGDFSAVGIVLKRNDPVPNFREYVKVKLHTQVQVRPDNNQ